MKPVIPGPTGRELTQEVAKKVESLVAELSPATTLEAAKARESIAKPAEKKIFQSRPSSRWGLNE